MDHKVYSAEEDVARRALAAYFRKPNDNAPAGNPGRHDGMLKGLRRWPAVIDEA